MTRSSTTKNFSKGFSERANGRTRTCDLAVSESKVVPLSQHRQLPNKFIIFAIYAVTLLIYTAAGPDPYPMGGGQLPNPNECN